MTIERLKELTNQFHHLKIAVIGDVILDHYLIGLPTRVSPEAPVLVLHHQHEEWILGGAANVAHNLAVWGAAVSLIGLSGEDTDGQILAGLLAKAKINNWLVIDAGRPTTTKTRVVALPSQQQMLRYDREEVCAITGSSLATTRKQIKQAVKENDIIVISDYRKGLLTSEIAQEVIKLAQKAGKKVLVDPKPESIHYYQGAYLVKPNKKEAEVIASLSFTPNYSNKEEIAQILERSTSSKVIVTIGSDGMLVFNDQDIAVIPTAAQEVVDVSGAGDTTMAAIAAAIAANATLNEAVIIANLAAGVAVGKNGTATVTLEEILNHHSSLDLAQILNEPRAAKKLRSHD